MTKWEEQSTLFQDMLRLFRFISIVFLLAHITGCIWVFSAIQYKDELGLLEIIWKNFTMIISP